MDGDSHDLENDSGESKVAIGRRAWRCEKHDLAECSECKPQRQVAPISGPLAYVCPVCKQGSGQPFRCGGPHPRPKRKRLYYDFVDAVPVMEMRR